MLEAPLIYPLQIFLGFFITQNKAFVYITPKKTQKPKSFGFENTNPGLVITQNTLLGINTLDPSKVGRMLHTQKIILGEL